MSAKAPLALEVSRDAESPDSMPTVVAEEVLILATVVLSKILRSAVMPVTVMVLAVMLAVVVGCVSE